MIHIHAVSLAYPASLFHLPTGRVPVRPTLLLALGRMVFILFFIIAFSFSSHYGIVCAATPPDCIVWYSLNISSMLSIGSCVCVLSTLSLKPPFSTYRPSTVLKKDLDRHSRTSAKPDSPIDFANALAMTPGPVGPAIAGSNLTKSRIFKKWGEASSGIRAMRRRATGHPHDRNPAEG